ncbi:MAG: aminotransferase class I/II-fold pyridoxal phosphate-dependent enzyme [Coriobacteriales bacterium]|nr:aminotransferase class I/II-fold pyridoxal phosphate-dependent enzyme [Coriobacteriales bacterium]
MPKNVRGDSGPEPVSDATPVLNPAVAPTPKPDTGPTPETNAPPESAQGAAFTKPASTGSAPEPAPRYRFDTIKVRGAYDPKDHNYAFNVPIYQTASYEMGSTQRGERLFRQEELGFLYTRVGNPTIDVLERRVAELDGAAASIALASGMAAVSHSILNLADAGDHIVSSPWLYGGTFDLFKSILPRYGINVSLATSLAPDDIKKQLRPNTKALFIESIANPRGSVADISTLANLAHEAGIPLIVDNTFATPYLVQPIKHGADVVVYSATKGLSGHGTVIAGLISESGKFNYTNGKFPQFTDRGFTLRDRADNFRSFAEVFPATPFTVRVRLALLNYLGAALGPFDAYLVLLGLETLSERLEKQLATVRQLVDYLQGNEFVSWVEYSSLPDSPNYPLAQKYAPRGSGTIFSFGFAGTLAQQERFIDSVRLFSYQVNVGDAKSLIVNSAKTTHSELTSKEQQAAGLAPEVIRLSVGLEDPRDLIEDLDQAFTATFGRRPERRSIGREARQAVGQKNRQAAGQADQ